MLLALVRLWMIVCLEVRRALSFEGEVLFQPKWPHIAILSSLSSAHGCSEIGLKWFLFALHDLGTALGFVSVLDFFGVLSFPESRRNG
jgi:hypothetical protein